MKAILKHEAGKGAKLVSTEIPKLKEDEVLVKIKASSICGTDVHIYEWDEWAQSRIKPPLIFGHECCGEVIELGKQVMEVREGDFISAETHISCRKCFQCLTGNEHICEKVKILGVDTQGVFADYAVLPAHNCWVNDKTLPKEIATAQEPLGNAVHTVMECNIPGSIVTVFGCGPIGLCAVALCKHMGARKVIAIDISDFKLSLAEKMGADLLLNDFTDDVVKEIRQESNGRGADVFLYMSGSEKALNEGFISLRAGGEASLLGIPNKPSTVDFASEIIFKGARVYGINGRKMYDTWFKAAGFLKEGAVDLRKIITHEFKMQEFGKAFEAINGGKAGKVILLP